MMHFFIGKCWRCRRCRSFSNLSVPLQIIKRKHDYLIKCKRNWSTYAMCLHVNRRERESVCWCLTWLRWVDPVLTPVRICAYFKLFKFENKNASFTFGIDKTERNFNNRAVHLKCLLNVYVVRLVLFCLFVFFFAIWYFSVFINQTVLCVCRCICAPIYRPYTHTYSAEQKWIKRKVKLCER